MALDYLREKFTQRIKTELQTHLAQVDVKIDGTRPWDIQVYDQRFYLRLFRHGSLGLGESYIERWWECSHLEEFFTRILRGRLGENVFANSLDALWDLLRTQLVNLQTLSRSFQVAQQHYDLGNDLYRAMLDQRMNYSCGYWKTATTLEQAQEDKLDLICRKLQLEEGMTLLDIGCGWGSLMKYAAQNYGVSCVGLTISPKQLELGQQMCQGLPIKFLLQDYRKTQGCFDRIVSVGMFEHVGYKNYRILMEIVNSCLKEDGLFLLQTIGNTYSVTYTELWIEKYIFPNSMIPSIAQIATAAEHLLIIEDLHNFGQDYAPTLMAWLKNFQTNWQQLQPKYGDEFKRIWEYYLCSCAGAFRARHLQLWQIIFSKKGILDGYHSFR